MDSKNDFPLSAVPADQRKGLWSMMSVLLGFTFLPQQCGREVA
ncbi:hypothetical protein [Psychromonas sp. KJ10-2]